MEMLNSLIQRKTIRKYTGKDISEELLHEILEAGVRASTTGNMQVYSIIVTRNEEKKEQLSPCHFNQPMVRNAPVTLTFCADFNRFNQWCRLNGAEPGYDNFLSFVTAAIDALLVAQTVCIAAEAKGLGICYLGTTTYTADKIIEQLKLPQGVVPVTTVTLGYPDEDSGQVERLPLEAVIHHEEYVDYNDDMIRAYYSDKEELPANKAFVAENKKQHLAQVFTDVRYKKADNEHFSEVLLNVLRQQGYLK